MLIRTMNVTLTHNKRINSIQCTAYTNRPVSKDMREMIDKVKNFKQFVNENIGDKIFTNEKWRYTQYYIRVLIIYIFPTYQLI